MKNEKGAILNKRKEKKGNSTHTTNSHALPTKKENKKKEKKRKKKKRKEKKRERRERKRESQRKRKKQDDGFPSFHSIYNPQSKKTSTPNTNQLISPSAREKEGRKERAWMKKGPKKEAGKGKRERKVNKVVGSGMEEEGRGGIGCSEANMNMDG